MIDNVTGAIPPFHHAVISVSDFENVLAERGCGRLVRARTTTLQINLGRRCNQACHHCHVNAGPNLPEMMKAEVTERALTVLTASDGITTVDITGGAPELNPSFRCIVTEARKLGCHVIDRSNLTVLLEPGMEPLPEFLAQQQVEIIASLPCYTAHNVDQQRGQGVFDRSIRALQRLNAQGYGMPGSMLQLNLMYNPLGAFLPPSQEKLEQQYRKQLREHYGIEFHHLFAIANMPIGRFAKALHLNNEYEIYLGLLMKQFNLNTVEGLMCRSLVSVGWNGNLYDCDFNQMIGLGIGAGAESIWNIPSLAELEGRRIACGRHCFGCTAGSGSSCVGSLQ